VSVGICITGKYYDTKVGILVCLEGNQTRGSQLLELIVAVDGTGLPQGETRPDLPNPV